MIELLLNPFLAIPILFVQFVIVMKIHHKAHNKVLHYALAIWFLPQDFIVNAVAISLIGLEPPKEYTVTARMKRWKRLEGYVGIKHWRWRFATRMCELLNKHDAGHC